MLLVLLEVLISLVYIDFPASCQSVFSFIPLFSLLPYIYIYLFAGLCACAIAQLQEG